LYFKGKNKNIEFLRYVDWLLAAASQHNG